MNRLTVRWQFAGAPVVLFGAITVAVLIGGALATGAYLGVAVFALSAPAIYLLSRPDLCLLYFCILTLVVSGVFKYFFEIGQFQWAASALGLALFAYVLIRAGFSHRYEKFPVNGVSQIIALWWGGAIVASISNMAPLFEWFVGLRIYLPVCGVFAYLAYCRPRESLLRQVLVAMILIGCVQWIFCLYQKMEIVPLRLAQRYPGSSWDSVVGTFGGDKFGGGESGSLGVYLSVIVGFVVSFWKYSQIRSFPFSAALFAVVVSVAMIESKVVVLMIPLGCLLVYREYAFRHPGKFIVGAMFVLVSMFALSSIYYYAYWQGENSLNLMESLSARFAYSFDPDFQASSTNLGRVKSLIFWWDMHSMGDNPLTVLIGHGLASAVSVSAIIGEGTQVQRYGVMLDVTGASKLLWETGLFGITLFILLFAVGFNRAQRLKRHPDVPDWHRAALSGVEAAMVLMPISIFYEVTVVSSPPMQFTAMFLLGYVAYWWRETRGARCG